MLRNHHSQPPMRKPTSGFRRLLVIAAGACLLAPAAQPAPGDTTLVSTSAPGSTGAHSSNHAVVSPDGRYILFLSSAPNLVADDANFDDDVFILDRVNGSLIRVDLPTTCDQPGGRDINDAAFSATGRYVAIGYTVFCLDFESNRGGLVRYDLQTNIATPVPGVVLGGFVPADVDLSSDGRFVAFVRLVQEEGEYRSAILHDIQTGTSTTVGIANDGTNGNDGVTSISMNAAGSLVAFRSNASNLVPGDTNGVSDIFLFSRSTGRTTRISKSTTDVQGNAPSYDPEISADGQSISFASDATNLVPGDTNGKRDIFVRQRPDNSTSLVSVDTSGTPANGFSSQPAISDNGRYVAFHSAASDLVANDTNGKADVFVRDRSGGTTSRLSLTNGGAQGNGSSSAPSISGDGRVVAFASFSSNFTAKDRNNSEDVFVIDRQAASLSLVSRSSTPAAGLVGLQPAVSGDGNYVAFYSSANALVPGDTNNTQDVFLRDRAANRVRRISVSSDGGQADKFSVQPSISSDGRLVAFISEAGNLVPGDTNSRFDIFVRDWQANTTKRVSLSSAGGESDGNSFAPRISADGQFVVFQSEADNLVPNDDNGALDFFVRDLAASTTERVTVTSSGEDLDTDTRLCCATISAGGRYVSFASWATNISPGDVWGGSIFLRDRLLGTTTQIDLSDADQVVASWSSDAALSANGRFVAFSSDSVELVPNDTHPGTDIYVRDRQTGTTTLVSKFPSGEGPPAESIMSQPSISADGRFVSFTSSHDNEFGDATVYTGTFVFDRQTGQLSRADVSSAGAAANNGAHDAALSGDGHTLVFVSNSTNLAVEPLAGAAVFARELPVGTLPKFAVTPASLAFGKVVKGGTSAARIVTISNTGSVPIDISKIVLAGANADQFRRVNNCPTQLPAGAQCTVSVKFKPTAKGTKTASLRVTPVTGSGKSVELSGTGI